MADVYMIYQNRLFGDAVRAILATQPNINLLGATDQTDLAEIEMAALTPGVVLFEEADSGSSMFDIYRFMGSLATCRLITLRVDRDGMHVWSGKWQQNVGPGDLVAAIIGAKEDPS